MVANNRHAKRLEEKLEREFLREIRALKCTFIYQKFRKPHVSPGQKEHTEKNKKTLSFL